MSCLLFTIGFRIDLLPCALDRQISCLRVRVSMRCVGSTPFRLSLQTTLCISFPHTFCSRQHKRLVLPPPPLLLPVTACFLWLPCLLCLVSYAHAHCFCCTKNTTNPQRPTNIMRASTLLVVALLGMASSAAAAASGATTPEAAAVVRA